MKTILLLEDDRHLNQGIALKLRKEGYEVLPALCVKEAKELCRAHSIDLIISDIMLGDESGLDFCAQVRKSSDVYIIFLTAMDQEIDMISAYDIGADDYITKPFSLMILLSKVHACMRRIDGKGKKGISSGNISVSYSEMKAYKDGVDLFLSKKELQLLVYLMENAGQVLSKEQVLEHIWDVDGQFVDDNTVPVYISRLRTKIGGDRILTVRGIGYIWINECIKE
ncbi:MAG: response regulator transcription factor [Eubacteriales bacterium]|nr:response regulator transcription factor [Eubacteriales bacterium]